ncbi:MULTISPECIES: GNAT family N-acetyltransferase [Providencia]|uniref:N-acetyltransferase n=3 Tax=Providencia TaxID=586 RepID=A0A264VZC5_PRORE|nr:MULTISPECIES: GNAT family N-acetyltransferase [Providencia]EFE55528.1 acetyltransferase, GNAT family [Providencia rettgeri DSM 1131]MRF66063.1 GNAT family N-acetyltransferase [Escherichia coli]QIF66057.1 GNAT family N-acetyltransferase [Providencia sp. 1709051003]THB25920.1 N-acetyltransferase [Providencia sp. MGF014]EHZ6871004.1 GNAT family N-acetyltransferase [Providencia rettgeri]
MNPHLDSKEKQSMAVIPELETDRLILNKHQVSDFPALAKLWATESMVRYIGGMPSSERESWMRMLAYGGLWPLLGFGYWAVREKASGQYIGDLGFADFHRMVEPHVKGIPEAGWVIAPEHQGKGYATEAMQAALSWLTKENKYRQSICFIEPRNLASLRVAEKLGYVVDREIFMNGTITVLLRQQLA